MIERVALGQIVRPRRVNDKNAIAEFAEEHQHAGFQSLRRTSTHPSRSVISLANDSGVDILAGAVLEVGDIMLTDPDPDNVWHEGLLPAPDLDLSIAIALEAVPSGEIGDRAFLLSGHCYCKINVTDAAHTHADPSTGTTVLQSGTSGRAKIVWKESGTGTKNALLLLPAGSSGPSSATYFGKLASDLTTGSTGTLTIWVDGSATADTVSVVNRTGQTLKAAILLQATQGIGCTEYLAGPYELETCA